ncbi:hypothetical protein [Winogradskyella sp. 3972H.M.0a.05]|uniref:hypothetical protein n=1 Tax=Winogradskyella sp. 3972H.M.0a.05 TaxID=2950277 RepID=UPI00339887EF
MSIISYAQERNCSDFKTGQFKYVDERLKEIITRTDSMQIEINPDNQAEIHTTIEWVSECEYVLTYTKIINWPENVSDVIGRKIYCTIMETKGNWVKVYTKGVSADGPVELIKIDNQ